MTPSSHSEMVERAAMALYEHWYPNRAHDGRGGWTSELVTDGDAFRAAVRVVLESLIPPSEEELDRLADKIMTDFYCGPTYGPEARPADNVKAAIKLGITTALKGAI